MQEISVITPYNLSIPYSYLAKKELNLKAGDIVLVTLRNRQTYGVVIENTDNNYKNQLKEIIGKVDYLSLSENITNFIKWAANYNCANLGVFLKMVFPIPEVPLEDITKQETEYFIFNKDIEDKLNLIKITPKEKTTLNYFINNIKIKKSTIKKEFNITINILNSLIKKNLIKIVKEETQIKSIKQNNINTKLDTNLNQEQKEAFKQLLSIINTNKFRVSLLDGVPGSGKTEVYFELIARVVKNNKAVLVLLPEIALSTQWTSRFKKAFNVEPYVWHSDVSKKEKKEIFADLLLGKIKVIVGTRSALFLPFINLGLIIIDEEHDSSFKQDEKIIYNARDMAIVRACFENISILLTTATPSVETWYNATKIGKYNYYQLNTRFNKSELPKIQLIDINKTKLESNEYISNELLQKLIVNFESNQQSLLFLNRRGYANINLCKNCKHKIYCPNCSSGEADKVYLIEHKIKNLLICHRCGLKQKIVKDCRVCNSENSIISVGFGIEKIAEELQIKIPKAKIALASSDILTSSVKANNLVESITNNMFNIIVGTQILAKGYHFPHLSLVGIVDDGLENTGIDLKSNERIWQLLYQVAGRAGREKIKGEVLIQSTSDNFLIQTLLDLNRNKFLEKELEDRKKNNMPPFSKLASVIITSKNEKKLNEYSNQLKKAVYLLPKEYQGVIEGPAPASFYKINNKFRNRFLIKTKRNINIQHIINGWLSKVKIPSNIFVKIDIDATSFY